MGRHLSRRRLTSLMWAAGLLGYVGMALADVWDPGDHVVFSTNELVHGSAQAHELGPGGVEGKAVALEPATGFTFETPLTPVPR
jgi:hypothetical protein